METKLTDTDLLEMMSKKLQTDYYTFGAYYDYNELDVKKAFKDWKEGIIKYYGLTLSDEDWKECFIHYANKTYGDIDEDELE